jgi:predicted ATPase/DNA-binding SARP family transcriptional activator
MPYYQRAESVTSSRPHARLRAAELTLSERPGNAYNKAEPPRAAVQPLRVQTLGGFSLLRGDEEIVAKAWQSERVWLLFTALLSVANHRLSRTQAIELLWPDKDLADPANSLREVLSKLRSPLGGDSGASTHTYVRSDGIALVLVPDTVIIDADRFILKAQRAAAERDLAQCQAAIELYSGDFLPQGTTDPSSRHASFLRARRVALRRTASDLFALAGELSEDGDPRLAAGYFQRAFTLTPAAEEKARQLMRCLARLGELAAVQEVFGSLVRSLAYQGVPPSDATVQLRDQLLDTGARSRATQPDREPPLALLTLLIACGEGTRPASVEAVIAAHGGSSIGPDRGDGHWRFSFGSPVDALSAARNLTSPARGAALPRGLRVAVHTGLTGQWLEKTSTCAVVESLAELAHPTQVLVSHVTCIVAEGTLPPAMALYKLDSYELASSVQAMSVYQLSSSDTLIEFPPLHARRHRPHNLPVAATTYLPRPRLQSRLGALLMPRTTHGTRLLTLTGVGGGGKTRLALQIAQDVLPHFRGGAWLVELASLTEQREVPAQIGRAIGLQEERSCSFMDTITGHLRTLEHPILLVLDNCEHLNSACAQASAAMLHASEYVYLLATSRERLGMLEERTEEVPLLSTAAESSGKYRLEDIGRAESVRLFCTRAAEAVSGFELSAAHAEFVARICSKLDGIPLATELAAAQLARCSLTEIVEGLDHCITLLASGNAGAMPRQQTLHAAIDWSYQLLSMEARMLFRRLGVFAGGWTLPAAVDICGQDGLMAEQVGPLLREVVLASLAIPYRAREQHRYRMLEPVRQFALDRLHAHGGST